MHQPSGAALGLNRAIHLPRVLIVEDTALIAMFLEDIVRECGCEVAGLAFNIETARQAVARANYDAVLLDIGLDGDTSFEIADLLLERGVPFAFVTAYHKILSPRHQKVPLILKPFSSASLMNTVRSLVQLLDCPQPRLGAWTSRLEGFAESKLMPGNNQSKHRRRAESKSSEVLARQSDRSARHSRVGKMT